MSRGQRIANLAPAEYSEDSELMQSLTLAVESMCKQIALHQLSVGEYSGSQISGVHSNSAFALCLLP